MLRLERHAMTQSALTALLAVALLAGSVSAPAPAAAVEAILPSSPPDSKAAVLAEIAQMKVEFARRVDEYVELNQRIEQTQAEVAQVNKEIDQQDRSLAGMRERLAVRVAELYRTDRIDMLAILLGSRSALDLVNRIAFLVRATQQDMWLITDASKARRENEWLQNHLRDRMQELTQLQADADARRARIERMIAFRQRMLKTLGRGVTALPRGRQALFSGDLPTRQFSPQTIISDAVFRNSISLAAADIQAFLAQQPGTLASYRGLDHDGRIRSAAEMIAEASSAWNVSPTVILVTLQKEQSLIGRSNPSAYAYDWAMGVGKTDSSTLTRYKGFGNQIWYGAATLSKNAGRWRSGAPMTIDGNVIYPTNSSTFSLYRYTPHIRGNTSFWMLYWRYFGDPLAGAI